jgi:steroid 5-alpha reductase family enzyme
MIMMTLLWIASIILKNVSIVDLFWGFGFVLTSGFYFLNTDGNDIRKIILMFLVTIWGTLHGVIMAREKISDTGNSGRNMEKKNTGG